MPDKSETYVPEHRDIKSDDHHDFPEGPPGPPGMGRPDAFTPPEDVSCNPETGNILDRDHNGIEGLYAAGNTMGGRFLVDYPVVTAGASHGFALTYSRLVGKTVAGL